MIIKNFEVSGLHGIIDANLVFYDDLNVIVGLNGAGKTSVLTLLTALIRVDFEQVSEIPFEYVKVVLHDATVGDIIISGQNNSKDSFLEFKSSNQEEKVQKIPLIAAKTDRRFYRFLMSEHAPAFSNRKFQGLLHEPNLGLLDGIPSGSPDLLAKISQLVKITFVKLDRTILAVDPQGNTLVDEAHIGEGVRSRQNAKPKDPIDEVLRVTQAKYFEYKKELNRIQSEAYRALLKLHFLPVKPIARKVSATQLNKKLRELKERVSRSSLTKDMHSATDDFFQSLEKLLQATESHNEKPRTGRRTLDEESIQLMLELKETQTESLLNIFENEQAATQIAWKPIGNYLEVIKKFLRESGKDIWFSDETLQLAVCVPTAGEKCEGTGRSVRDLSSGERQILIVLTYLAFMTGKDSIFIIDEPELSLHLRWQSYLVEALKQLRPEGGQIIVATHAPEIAGRARDRSLRLRQKYHSITLSKDD